jgi:hypothetical protein
LNSPVGASKGGAEDNLWQLCEPEGVERVASKCPKRGRVDDSETIPPSPRAALMLALAHAVREGALGGDTELVRAATDTLARLLKDGEKGTGLVVDLKKEGEDRGGKRDRR